MYLVINRPALRNAFNENVINLIAAGVRQAQASSEIRAIVLTGAGDRAFCAGGDLSAADADAPFSVDPARPRNFVIDLFKLIEECELPVIARINGHALAGGLGLVCACDLAIAADHARFGVPEVKIGLFPMMIMPYLMRIVPPRRLMQMCMTGSLITASEAAILGLINEAVPASELDVALDRLLEGIASASPTAQRLGKHGLHAMRDMTIRQAWEFAELMLPMMAATEDAKEGFAAFRQKRAPVWTGK
ncbi:MAG: enoyl-CoA hydratase-related protein [Rhodospirillales bacterium]